MAVLLKTNVSFFRLQITTQYTKGIREDRALVMLSSCLSLFIRSAGVTCESIARILDKIIEIVKVIVQRKSVHKMTMMYIQRFQWTL